MIRFQRFLTTTSPHCVRCFASSWTSTVLRYSEYGDPEKILRIESETVSSDLAPRDVALRHLASPVNPADVNTLQGVYPVKPKLPAVGGFEGVSEVLAVGSSVEDVRKGDYVLPSSAGFGTWRTISTTSADNVLKIPSDLSIIAAATVAVNPCTAYRMLHDYTSLRKGDVIVQNGANSAAGQAVIQIAAAKEWKTINIIRDRPNNAETAKHLASLGATYVITDADFKRPQLIQELPKARLALNCVGGKAVSDMVKLMDVGTTLVTYGGMSKQPLIVPTAALIFKDIVMCGYWMSRYNLEVTKEAKVEMLEAVSEFIRKGQLKPPILEPVLLKDYKLAVQRTQEGYIGRKQLFVMDEEIMEKVKKEIEAISS